jgi:hypothetical protein
MKNKIFYWFLNRRIKRAYEEIRNSDLGLEVIDAGKFENYQKKMAKKDVVNFIIIILLAIYLVYKIMRGGN